MIRTYLQKILSDDDLSQKESQDLTTLIYKGQIPIVQLAAFLVALRMKGAVITETSGMITIIRKKMTSLQISKRKTVDICGTGGDIVNTINVSTLAAFVAAGAGVVVTKQANNSVTSNCGSADLLEAMGLGIRNATPAKMSKVINKHGLGFLYTPRYNKIVDILQPIVDDLRISSIYNVLLPITNLANARGMVVGVNNPNMTTLVAQTLREIGVKRAFVVNGAPAIDEISIVGPTKVSELADGKVKVYTIKPEDFGYETGNIEEIIGGENIDDNLKIAEQILSGKEKQTSRTEMVLLNAAAAIVAGGGASDLKAALDLAEESLYKGRAYQKYKDLKKVLK